MMNVYFEDGISPLRVLMERELWDDGEDRSVPNLAKIEEVAKTIPPNQLVCVNIEQWETADELRKNIPDVVKAIRDNCECLLGLYSMVPSRLFGMSIAPSDDPGRIAWRRWNYEMRDITELMDVIFPSLYTLTKDPELWVRFADSILIEAGQYGLPVIPFAWWVYHSQVVDSDQAGQPVEDDYWRLQLQYIRQHADSVVLWDEDQGVWPSPAPSWWTIALETL